MSVELGVANDTLRLQIHRRQRFIVANWWQMIPTRMSMSVIVPVLRDVKDVRAARDREQIAHQQELTAKFDLLLSDVDRLAARQDWEAALETAKRAEAMLGGNVSTEAMTKKAAAAIAEIEFVLRLSEIRLETAGWLDPQSGDIDQVAKARLYGAAFRQLGVDLQTLSTTESLTKLQQHPLITLPMASALDDAVLHLRGNNDGINKSLNITLPKLSIRIHCATKCEQSYANWWTSPATRS